MDQVTVSVSGMSCGHCVARVRKALAGLPGVAVEEVTIGEARVSIDPTLQSLAAVLSALDAAGYPASLR